MARALTDDLDATIHELDRLNEVWMQTQAYQGALTRLRYLAPLVAGLLDDMRQVRLAISPTAWLGVQQTLLRAWPAEMASLEQALMTGDESFWRLVGCLGYVRGVLAMAHGASPRELSPDVE